MPELGLEPGLGLEPTVELGLYGQDFAAEPDEQPPAAPAPISIEQSEAVPTDA